MENINDIGFYFWIFYFITIFIILVIWFLGYSRRNKARRYFSSSVIDKDNKLYKDVDKSVFDSMAIDNISLFKGSLYEIFLYFEYAYNSFNYNRMKLFCTDELYNMYCANIDLYVRKGNKKIIENVNRNKDIIVFKIENDNNRIIVHTIVDISYISYTVNKYGFVIRGNKKRPLREIFKVTFVREFNLEYTNCPNCGAPLKDKKCEFCNYVIEDNKFKISSINKIIGS